VDTSGNGLPGAEIRICDFTSALSYRVGTSGSGGAFTLRGLEPGRYLAAHGLGYVMGAPIKLRGNSGAVQKVRLVLSQRGARLEGIVLDAANKPVPGARIAIGTEFSFLQARNPPVRQKEVPPLHLSTTSDAQGRFAIDGAPISVRTLFGEQRYPITLHAAKEGFALLWQKVQLEPGITNYAQLRLTRSVTLSGRVLEQNRAPCKGARIWRSPVSSSPWSNATTVSRDDGHYTLTGLPAGSAFGITVSRHGKGSVSRQFTGQPGEVLEWNPVLGGGLKLHGYVLDADGKGLEGWLVRADSQKTHDAVETNADGYFSLVSMTGDVEPEPDGEQRPGLTPRQKRDRVLIAAAAGLSVPAIATIWSWSVFGGEEPMSAFLFAFVVGAPEAAMAVFGLGVWVFLVIGWALVGRRSPARAGRVRPSVWLGLVAVVGVSLMLAIAIALAAQPIVLGH